VTKTIEEARNVEFKPKGNLMLVCVRKRARERDGKVIEKL